MLFDFSRDHASSPCLSTAIGNRQRSIDEGRTVEFLWFPFPFVAKAARAGDARCRFSIKPLRIPTSAQRTPIRKIAKIGQIIFSRSSRSRCRGTTRMPDVACKQAEMWVFSTHGRDAGGLAWDFMRACRIRSRKAACHGHWRARRARDRISLDGEPRAAVTASSILRRKWPDSAASRGAAGSAAR